MVTAFYRLAAHCQICKSIRTYAMMINGLLWFCIFSFIHSFVYLRYGVVLARYQARPEIKTTGCFGSMPLVAFTSDESHYSIRKSVQWLGIGSDNLIVIKTDDNGCMLVDDLISNIEKVLMENRQPFFVNATAGSTVLGAFDDLNVIADVCEKYGLWMHVDVSLTNITILHSDE